MVHLGVILGYVVSKEGKPPDLKKILAIVHMPTSKTPKDIQVFNGITQYYRCSSRTLFSLWLPLPSYYRR
jgi:hypothetical protein